MFRIGIDVGSTYTKYCIMNGKEIIDLFTEKSPLRQNEYFEKRIEQLKEQYGEVTITSCGYGKANVSNTTKKINELTALARGSFFITGENATILDIGGQDTKIIQQEQGSLTQFFINDKCAAGSGMFLSNTLERIGKDFQSIDLIGSNEPVTKLSSVCAVFAQSEIVEMIANNKTEDEIIAAVIWQIVVSAKKILEKVSGESLLLSGGMTKIPGFADFAKAILGKECHIPDDSPYLSAIGCVI